MVGLDDMGIGADSDTSKEAVSEMSRCEHRAEQYVTRHLDTEGAARRLNTLLKMLSRYRTQ